MKLFWFLPAVPVMPNKLLICDEETVIAAPAVKPIVTGSAIKLTTAPRKLKFDNSISVILSFL
jgi:hypothetical protein